MKTVVITGASGGVGRALARAYADRECRIGLIARGRKRLEETAREVRERGGEALVLPLDVADAEAVAKAASTCEAELGFIDLWINGAMVTVFSPIERLKPEEIHRVTAVTYLGAVHGTMTALNHMRPRGRGTIVQIASAIGYRAIPLQSAYCAAKAAMIAFSDSLRTELRHDGVGIDVTMMQLPAVNTPQFEWARNKMPKRPQPVPPIYRAEAVAEAIAAKAESGEREIWIGRPAMKAILAQKLAPNLAERMLADSAWSGQMTDEPGEAGRPDNLFEPVETVPSEAEGRFLDRAKAARPMTLGTTARNRLLAGGGAAAAGTAALLLRRILRSHGR